MDDGSHAIDRHKTTGKIRAHSFHWYTVTNAEDTQNIIDYFKEVYDIKFYPLKNIIRNPVFFKCQCKHRTQDRF